MDSNRLQVYGERVRPRNATPLDNYANAALLWAQQMWMVWVAIAACLIVLIVIIAVSRSRTRAHARVPHYRRQETGPIPVVRLRNPVVRTKQRDRRS
ncbi:MAG: hypothetical protein ABJA94_06885 [Rhodoglobus sp.]